VNVGWWAAGGAMTIALVMALAPTAAAVHPGGLPSGSAMGYSLGESQAGCGKIKVSTPSLNTKTGVESWSGASNVPCSSKGFYGVGSDNLASGDFSTQLYIPVKFNASSVGVNVSLDFKGSWAEKSSGSLPSTCPLTSTYNYSYYYSFYPSWVNTTDSYGDCALESSVNIYGSAELEDATSGGYCYETNYWDGIYHDHDSTGYSYSYRTNWSNPSYWSNNATSYGFSGYTSGGNAAGAFSAANSPTWWFNLTSYNCYNVVYSDSLWLEVYLDGSVNAEVDGALHGSASASLDLAGSGNGIAISETEY
jgi:hypothetical protein